MFTFDNNGLCMFLLVKSPFEENRTGLYFIYIQFRTTIQTGSSEPSLLAYTNVQLRGHVSIILFLYMR